MPEKTPKLKESCRNCYYLLWYDNNVIFAPGAKCTHSLMSKKRCKDLDMSECLFWKGGDV